MRDHQIVNQIRSNAFSNAKPQPLAGAKRSFFDQILILSLVSCIFSGELVLATAMLSPSESSVPQFWFHSKDSKSPDSAWLEMRTSVLNDESGRITSEFEVPAALRQRTEFWFDIYTRYGSDDHVLHHTLYPWIVYKVIDVSSMIASGKGPLWLRRDRAEKFVKQEAAALRKRLRKLANKPNAKNLSSEEKEIVEKLKAVPGARRKIYKQAANYLRKQLGQRDYFRNGLINSSRYLPYMEEKFGEMGLPIELTRIPFVESSFNEKAFSKAGASGVWQIMPRTGAAYMIVNPTIDERNSPIKSTLAAAQVLKQYFRITKDWPLAVTSYNHGIGNIQHAIKGARSTNLSTIIDRYHRGHFQFASANYFTCFLAALHAEKYNELVFNDLAREPLLEHDVVILKSKTSISRIIALTGLSRDQLLAYNLDLKEVLGKRNNILPRGFELHIPKGADAQATMLGSKTTAKLRQTSI